MSRRFIPVRLLPRAAIARRFVEESFVVLRHNHVGVKPVYLKGRVSLISSRS